MGHRFDDLINAVVDNDLRRIRALIALGAPINGQNESGESPFSYACAYDSFLAAQMLRTSGADVNLPLSDGSTPLDTAACHTSPEFWAWLLAIGARRGRHYEGHSEKAH